MNMSYSPDAGSVAPISTERTCGDPGRIMSMGAHALPNHRAAPDVVIPPAATGLLYLPVPEGASVESGFEPIEDDPSVRLRDRIGDRNAYDLRSGEHRFEIRS